MLIGSFSLIRGMIEIGQKGLSPYYGMGSRCVSVSCVPISPKVLMLVGHYDAIERLRAESTLARVQRLFSMFPRGAPGFALLLLRICVGTSVLLGAWSDPHRGGWMLAMSIAHSILLCVGLLTPVAALLTIPAYLVDTASLRIAPTAVVILIVQAIALSLLGPGSCSIDAYLYGHRVVVLPQKSDRDTG